MRLFVGIELPETARQAVAEHLDRNRAGLPPARWVRRENLHFTLVFLGEREDAELLDLETVLKPVFAACRPFSLQLAKSGAFPPGGPARVAWIGLEQPGEMQGLQSGVVAALRTGGSEVDDKRPYHPHLTVARCKWPWPRIATKRWVASLPGKLGEPFDVKRGLLFESRLSRQGATYRIVSAFPLEGTR